MANITTYNAPVGEISRVILIHSSTACDHSAKGSRQHENASQDLANQPLIKKELFIDGCPSLLAIAVVCR